MKNNTIVSDAFTLLKNRGIVHTQKDFAALLDVDAGQLSRALKGSVSGNLAERTQQLLTRYQLSTNVDTPDSRLEPSPIKEEESAPEESAPEETKKPTSPCEDISETVKALTAALRAKDDALKAKDDEVKFLREMLKDLQASVGSFLKKNNQNIV